MQNRSLLLILILGLFFSASAQKKALSIAEQISLKAPSGVVVSPSGDRIAYTVRSADLQKSEWNYQVYVLNTSDNSVTQFTHGTKSAVKPGFSPDGKYLAFLSARDYVNPATGATESGTKQLWTAPLNGGDAKPLTLLPNDVDEYAFSVNGDQVACLSDEFVAAKEDEAEKAKKTKNDEQVFPKSNPAKVLTVYSFPSGELLKSITLDPGAMAISFHPDGLAVIYQSNLTGEYNDEQKYDIYFVRLSDGRKTQMTKLEGPETQPALSPDAKYLAYISQTSPDIEFAETDLSLVNMETGKTENITANFDRSVNAFLWKNETTLLFTVNEGTFESIYTYSLTSKELKRLSDAKGSYSEVTLTRDGKLCAKFESPDGLPEVFFNGKVLTTYSDQLKPYLTGSQEVIKYPSKDGKFIIEGLLFKPENYDPAKKYPLILTCHGGPYGNFKNTFSQGYPIRQLLAEGFLVFSPNPRGSSGYSDAFSKANRYDLGGGDYSDIMAGVDYLIGKGLVDSSRMGVMGGSYGGYMTNWIISQTPRFKAAVSLYGIFSFFTDFSNSWQPIFEKMYFGYNYWERPIDMNNLFVKLSPSTYANQIKTPTLILQGEKDVYTDISNSREMYQALHTIGLPVEFVVYPREGHGLRGEPNHYINTVNRTIGWFNKYLK